MICSICASLWNCIGLIRRACLNRTVWITQDPGSFTVREDVGKNLKKFAVLQLSGCAGCEVSLLNADEWLDQYRLVYMPLVISAYDVPEVDVLLVSGGVLTEEDLHNLRRAVRRAEQVVAVGTCAISGGVASLGNRPEIREVFLAQDEHVYVPKLLPKCRPIDAVVEVDRYLPGCPPTPELFMAVLRLSSDFKPGKTVCQECKGYATYAVVGFSAGRSATRHLLDQPGVPVRRNFDQGRMPRTLHHSRISLRRLQRTV